ncbi:MAG TPA: HlyC/CorC family transporter [Firmicutes bacterium]|jgi:putative hemolysin|nr:HlyC/CorC family transporter [Bacillota bacterium]
MDDSLNEVILIGLLIMLNALFASSEIALISVRKHRMEELAKQGSKAAEAVLRITNEPDRLLATIQIGITMANMLASATAAVGLTKGLAQWLAGIPIPVIAKSASGIAVLFVTLIISYLTLVIGELVPKRLALQFTEIISLRVARFLTLLSKLAAPFVSLLTLSTRTVMWMLGVREEADRDKVSEQEILHMVTSHDAIPIEEKAFIRNVFELGDTVAKDVMIPRHKMQALPVTATAGEAVMFLNQHELLRLPVYEASLDNLVGQVTIHAAAGLTVTGHGDEPISTIVQPISAVPETKRLSELLAEMQENNERITAVADEYGATVGLITLDDLIKEVVAGGDKPEELATILTTGELLVPGGLSIRDGNKVFSLGIPESEDYATLAGFILSTLDRVPGVNDTVQHGDLIFKVESIAGHRIERVRIQSVQATETNKPADDDGR